MSQMFETDVASLLPAAQQTDKATPSLSRWGEALLLFADVNRRCTQLEKDQLRLLDLLEKAVEMDKLRSEAFDLLYVRVMRLEHEAGLDVAIPFPGQDDDFGLAPKPKKV